MSLGHLALLARVKSGEPLDTSDPVIQAQLWAAGFAKKEIQVKIQTLRVDASEKKSTLNKQTSFRDISRVNFYMIDEITKELSEQLFDVFIPEAITSDAQAVWKEYFHELYELLIIDGHDPLVNMIVMREMHKYHDVLDEPTIEPAPTDTVIHNIKRLFGSLKREHLVIRDLYQNLEFQMKESARVSMKVYLDLHTIQAEIQRLSSQVRDLTVLLESVRLAELAGPGLSEGLDGGPGGSSTSRPTLV